MKLSLSLAASCVRRELQYLELIAFLLAQSKPSLYSLIWNSRAFVSVQDGNMLTATDSSPPEIKYGHSPRRKQS